MSRKQLRRSLTALSLILDHTTDLLATGALDDPQTRHDVIRWNRAAAMAARGDRTELHELRVAAGLDRHGRSDDAPAFLAGDVTLPAEEAPCP